MEKVPFFQIVRPEDRYVPHVRIGFLVYCRYFDWHFGGVPYLHHLFWRFWWRRWDWKHVGYWLFFWYWLFRTKE